MTTNVKEQIRLKKLYETTVREKLVKEFGYKNVHQVPKLLKIVVSSVTRDAVVNAKVVDTIKTELATITGQAPVAVKAKKSIASFKLRQGQPLGAMVTLRNKQMYEFFDKLVNFSLPRVKDFRGVSTKSFDGIGGYTLGLKEQIIFPEINYDKVDKIRGLSIVVSTSAKSSVETKALLENLGFPFRK